MAADVWTEAGQPAPVGVTGELVCTRPFPSMPLGFWGDTDGARYQAAYFEACSLNTVGPRRFRGPVREHGGFVISGRSDATLNPGGVRIGTA